MCRLPQRSHSHARRRRPLSPQNWPALPDSSARGLDTASALSRFHQRDDALAKLDALVALLDGPGGERLEDGPRKALTASIQALRRCAAATEPAPLATISVHVFGEGVDGRGGSAAGGGVYLDVEGIRVGRTGTDGTLQAVVPSGRIRIRAIEYPSSIGDAEVTLPPGASPPVSIVLADSKEPTEDSELVLEQAPDGILPSDAASLTLTFGQDDAPVSIERVQQIEVSIPPEGAGESLEELFTVSQGVIRASNAAAVHRRILQHAKIGRLLSLDVSAIDTEGRFHYGVVRFLAGTFKLAVTLAAPPSNPALPVANVPVWVSIVGTEVAVRRTSDANGLFEVDSLPDATVAFRAHTVSSGIHYYANATLTMCADRTVTLALLNVKDLVAGARGLIVGSVPAACPPVPRR